MITKEQFKSIFIKIPRFKGDLYRSKIDKNKSFLIEFNAGKVTLFEKGYPVFSVFNFADLERMLPVYLK